MLGSTPALRIAANAILLPLATWAATMLLKAPRPDRPTHRTRYTIVLVVSVLLSLVTNRLTPSDYAVRVWFDGDSLPPAKEFHVWSPEGGEVKQVEGGWEIAVPSKSRQPDGSIHVRATHPRGFSGTAQVFLESDPVVSVRMPLARTVSRVRGIVVDEAGRALAGVRVAVLGYTQEAFETGRDGMYDLPAHVPDGEVVQLHIECAGFAPDSPVQAAGPGATTLVMTRGRGPS